MLEFTSETNRHLMLDEQLISVILRHVNECVRSVGIVYTLSARPCERINTAKSFRIAAVLPDHVPNRSVQLGIAQRNGVIHVDDDQRRVFHEPLHLRCCLCVILGNGSVRLMICFLGQKK